MSPIAFHKRHIKIAAAALIAAALIFPSATLGMLKRMEPFYSWYYVFNCLSYIVAVESYLHCKGLDSSLFQAPKKFFLQLPLSVSIWLGFEVSNFHLQNWRYVQVPPSLPLRWTGYAVPLATVLPGLNATSALIRRLLTIHALRTPPMSLERFLRRHCIRACLLPLLLPLLWLGVFFPLVWLAFILILAPLESHDGHLDEVRSGRPGRLIELMLSGMVRGFFWELWNYRAAAKWIYTVPLVGWLKVFEMPLLEFLGFPHFCRRVFSHGRLCIGPLDFS